MSFSGEVKHELISVGSGKRCCRRSFFNGMLMAAHADGKHITISLTDTESKEKLISELKYFCEITPTVSEVDRGFCKMSILFFDSESIASTLNTFDNLREDKENPTEKIFKCTECTGAFIRGIFCACGSVSDPRKTYCLEMILPSYSRAVLTANILTECGLFPGITERKKRTFGVFFRNSGAIEDVMTVCKATKTVFELYNLQIENEIRNNENRATNCVTTNIMRTVNATGEQIDAIEAIIAGGYFDELPEELRMTARLRLEYSNESLSELASLHKPPISKSGLNHRLKKINEIAKKLGVI